MKISASVVMFARSASLNIIAFVNVFPMAERISVKDTSTFLIFLNSSSVNCGERFFISMSGAFRVILESSKLTIASSSASFNASLHALTVEIACAYETSSVSLFSISSEAILSM